MTQVGAVQQLGNGLTQKQYSYSPLNALVDIVFNAAGQIVQATVAKATGSSGSSATASVTGSATSVLSATSAASLTAAASTST